MCERPLLAVLPKPLKSGDEIILKGQVHEDPQEFSINFTIDNNPQPMHVAYHFKVHYKRNLIIQNYKVRDNWYEEQVMDNDYFDQDNKDFHLKFALSNSEIITYRCDEYDGMISPQFICSFELKLALEQIKTVQVWGDVEKINEVTFK